MQYKNMAEAVHILLPTAVEATREGFIPPQVAMWLYRRNLPRDRARMNISNTCQLSSFPDPHPIPTSLSLQEVTASGWQYVTWFPFHFLYTYLSVAKGTSVP